MKRTQRLMSLAVVAGSLFFASVSSAQRIADIYINKMLLKGDDDAVVNFVTKDYMNESGKNNTSFEIIGVRLLDNSNRYLVFGKHEITADHKVSGESLDVDINATHGKDELKFHMARFPRLNYQFVALDENDVKDLLENVKQLRSNYIESDTVKIKDETRYFVYRLNKDFAVSMSRGKNGGSAKTFEIWVGTRRQEVSSDKFILMLTQFLGTIE